MCHSRDERSDVPSATRRDPLSEARGACPKRHAPFRCPSDLGRILHAPPAAAPLLRQLDATTSVLGSVLYTLSTLIGAGLATIGISVIVHMDASSRNQGGAFYVGIGVVIALAWMVGSLISLGLRRR